VLASAPAAAWGARPEEFTARTPADALIEDPDEHWVRAVDVAASAELTWRWLCQMRVAPYSYDLVDNLGRRSPQELTAGLDELETGQRVMTIFTLESFARGEHLTVKMRPGVALMPPLAVSYVVSAAGPSSCRLTMHLLVRLGRLSRNPAGRAALALLRAGDLVMARRQLLNLKGLAERDARRHPAAARPTEVASPARLAEFGFPGPLRDRLVAAILRGEKTATSSLAVEWEADEEPLPRAGERETVVDSEGRPIAVIEVVATSVIRLGDADLALALDEGEGFRSVAEWRAEHERFWNDGVRPHLGGPAAWRLDDDTRVVVQRFRLAHRLS
jgi:uncharacterized protein YhfF